MCVYVSTVNSRVLVVIFLNPEFLCSVIISMALPLCMNALHAVDYQKKKRNKCVFWMLQVQYYCIDTNQALPYPICQLFGPSETSHISIIYMNGMILVHGVFSQLLFFFIVDNMWVRKIRTNVELLSRYMCINELLFMHFLNAKFDKSFFISRLLTVANRIDQESTVAQRIIL